MRPLPAPTPLPGVRSTFGIASGLVAALLVLAGGLRANAGVPDVRLDPVATVSGLATDIRHAGDERLFISQLDGEIRLWSPTGGLSPIPFLDLGGVVDTTGDGGLLSFAFHPNYAANGRLFVAYTETGVAGNPLRSVIARYTVSALDPDVDPPNIGLF